jgi:hypothetical protein
VAGDYDIGFVETIYKDSLEKKVSEKEKDAPESAPEKSESKSPDLIEQPAPTEKE